MKLSPAIIYSICLLLGACMSKMEPTTTQSSDLILAINVGGPAILAGDGTPYAAENYVSGGNIGQMQTVKGSQDPDLYRTYRAGDIRIVRPQANGVYDLTLHFAEPDNVAGGDRIFDVYVEQLLVINDLDIMASRDGKIESALTVTVPNVEIKDGKLNVEFVASAGQPVLSAFVLRSRDRPSSKWKLVWSDEFDGEEIDAEKWSPDIWPARKVNDEDQAYTSRNKNLRVEDGMLVIEAHKEDYKGAQYTSGRVHSAGKGDFLYGRFEVRAKLAYGKGSWAAIWMLPSDPYKYSTTCDGDEDWQGSTTCDAWPNSGEIDIMEHVGYQMGHVHGTVHNEAYYWLKWEQRKGRVLLDDVDEAFHVYALEWTPERIDIFVDDTHYFTYINEGEGWQAWPYNHPFHLILNVAVGGGWGRAGGGIDDSIFPQQMLVDYVRVYRAAD